MLINVFGNSSSSYDNGNEIDTTFFVEKPYLRSNYIDAYVEEGLDLKNQYRNKNLPDPISIREAAWKKYTDNNFSDPSVMTNPAHVDFNDKNLDNVHYIRVNSFPTLEGILKEIQLTPKNYVDQTISEGVDDSSLLRLDPDEKLKLDEQDSIVLNSTLTLPKTIIELPTKSYVDRKLNDPSIIRNNTHVDFNDKNLDNVKFVIVNSMPAVLEHLTPKHYVDQAIFYHMNEPSLLRLGPDEKLKLDEQVSIFLISTLTSPKTIIGLPSKSYVASLHESSRNRRDLSSVFNDQDNEFDNKKLPILNSVSFIRNPSSDNELANKKYVDDSIDGSSILRFNQKLESYLKVSVGNDVYIVIKFDKIQLVDTTIIKQGNGQYILTLCKVFCNDKKIIGVVTNFIRSTKTNSPTQPFRSNEFTTNWC